MEEKKKYTIIVMQMTPRGGGTARRRRNAKTMRWIRCLAVAAIARRHIEDVCSLANAYSKSVLDVFTIQTRLQANLVFISVSLFPFSSVAKAADGRGRRSESKRQCSSRGRKHFCKKYIETMQDYPLALINRKERHPDNVLVHDETAKKKNN